jgi:hypothetical protein
MLSHHDNVPALRSKLAIAQDGRAALVKSQPGVRREGTIDGQLAV